MPAQRLRINTRLTQVSRSDLRHIQPELENACANHHTQFFRRANRVVTFEWNNIRFRIDVDTANDQAARRQMNLPAANDMLYAQLQTGSGQTIANIIYPDNQGMVQLTTLISALEQSMAERADFTAIH